MIESKLQALLIVVPIQLLQLKFKHINYLPNFLNKITQIPFVVNNNYNYRAQSGIVYTRTKLSKPS